MQKKKYKWKIILLLLGCAGLIPVLLYIPVAYWDIQTIRQIQKGQYSEAYSHLLQMATEDDSAWAQNMLGCMYLEGNGVWMDKKKSFRWFYRAAVNGNRHALYNLGLAYELGSGIEKNLPNALIWYEKAAKAGDADAYYKIGEILLVEEYINEESRLRGIKNLVRAGKAGNESADFLLFLVQPDKAKKFYTLSEQKEQLKKNRRAHFLCGLILLKRKEYNTAWAFFEQSFPDPEFRYQVLTRHLSEIVLPEAKEKMLEYLDTLDREEKTQ